MISTRKRVYRSNPGKYGSIANRDLYSKLTCWFTCLLVIGFVSCKSPNQGAGSKGMEEAGEDILESVERIEQIKKVYHLIPSPAEMLSVMNIGGLDFDKDLLNPTSNIEKYFDSKTKTLNLGVYITDLAFAAIFGRHDETIEYLEAVQDLAEQARVEGAINEELISRAKGNVQDLDTLFILSNEAFINMITYCEETHRSNTMILITAGAFVESLYLATSLVGSSAEADYLIQHLADQKYSIDNLLTFAKSLEDDPNVTDILADLKPLEEIYSKLDKSSGETQVKKEGAGKLVIGGGSQPTLSQEEFEKLRETVSEIRQGIISGTI
ncbi:MAG: hypothetical protein ISS19_03770 [Bacteroidales bacterium]|nr:hypothetical protein [Bacteroidales bacterium]